MGTNLHEMHTLVAPAVRHKLVHVLDAFVGQDPVATWDMLQGAP